MEVAVDEEEETDSSANEEDYGFAEVQSTRYCNFKLLNEFQLINVGC